MTAFAAAINVIFADRNMATDARWLPGGVSPGTPVRVIRRAPDVLSDYGSARLWSETTQVDVMVVHVPNPAPGDQIVLAGEAFVVQGEPTRDHLRLIWTLDLRPA